MSKHTPGNWRISHIIVGRVSSRAEIKSGDTHIATVYAPGSEKSHLGCPTKKQAFANRSLIAAAPDLLEALEAVVRVADRATVEFDMARAAIAKARGEP